MKEVRTPMNSSSVLEQLPVTEEPQFDVAKVAVLASQRTRRGATDMGRGDREEKGSWVSQVGTVIEV